MELDHTALVNFSERERKRERERERERVAASHLLVERFVDVFVLVEPL